MPAEMCLDARDLVGGSIIWSSDDRALFWVDILGRRIHRFAPGSGDHQVWPTPHFPTSIGMCARGGFIVGLRRTVCLWKPGGPVRVERTVELPCSWPASCTFGGADLRTLHVTSARFTMSAEHLAANPQEGGLFAVEVGLAGVPETMFAG